MLVGKVIFNIPTLLMLSALYLDFSCLHHLLLLWKGEILLLVYLKLVINLIVILLILGWLPVFGNLLVLSSLVHFGTDF